MDLHSFEIGPILGAGTYGVVRKATERSSGEQVAIKFQKTQAHAIPVYEGSPQEQIREASLLKWLNEEGDHIVKLKEPFFDEQAGSLSLPFEFHDYTLTKFVTLNRQSKRGPIKPQLTKVIMKDLLQGVHQMHSHGIAHRDLKPENLLVKYKRDGGVSLRVADLGLGRNLRFPTLPEGISKEVQTLWYRAPEVLLGGGYSLQIDMWSVGVIFAELLFGDVVFRGDSEFFQLICIFQALGTPTNCIWPGVTSFPNWHEYPAFRAGLLSEKVLEVTGGDYSALDLLKRMLAYNPASRIHAGEALSHPYFH